MSADSPGAPPRNDVEEIPLSGGRTTPGVVRAGDTVRRPATVNSGFVHRLLEYLAAQGFGGVPESLGKDTRGRDVYTFIDGDVPADLAVYGEPVLRIAALLIRSFHDASAGFVTSQVGAEVVCHNDLSPCNFVFRGKVPVAIIDFDAAAPGTRVDDLGYAAWLWLDLGSDKVSARDQHRRLMVFVKTYGTLAVEPVVDSILQRQVRLLHEARTSGDSSMAEWAARCNEWTRDNRRVLLGG